MLEAGALESTDLSYCGKPFFFSFLRVGKNILKKYLHSFVVIKYLRIFVENNNKKRHEYFN